MKKSKLLALAALASLGLNANAADLVISEGETVQLYYIQNVESGEFLSGANEYGTRGTVSVQADQFKIVQKEKGLHLSNQSLSCSNKHLGSNLYTDASDGGADWTITSTGSGEYTIKTNVEVEGVNCERYLAQSEENGTIIGHVLQLVEGVTNAAKWRFLTKEEAIAQLNNASASSPMNASFLIGDANFTRNHSSAPWTVDAANYNMAGGYRDNLCAEHWRSAFNVSQSFSDIPNGKYVLTAQAALTDYANKYDGANYPVVYANEKESPFLSMEEGDRGTNMATLSNSFTAGKYVVTVDNVIVTNGNLTIGVKGTRTDTWCIYDNFQLQYLGAITDLTSYKPDFESAKAAATGIDKTKAMNKDVKSTLEAAIKEYGVDFSTLKTATAIQTATEALREAANNANSSIAIYEQIVDINTKANALDAAGKAAYEETKTAYENGTLSTVAEAQNALIAAAKAQTTPGSNMTAAIANPNFDGNINGWTDEFSGKLNHGFQNNSTYGTINQFMECWAGYWSGAAAPYKLPNGKLYQEITGLPEGNYTLTADVIATQQEAGNSGYIASLDEVTGIYLFAGDIYRSKALNVTAAAESHTVSLTFNASGDTKIGIMAENTNCNWMVMDNVKLVYNGSKVVGELALTDMQATDNLTGEYNLTYTRKFTLTEKWQALYVPFAIDVDKLDLDDIAIAKIESVELDGSDLTINIKKVVSGKTEANTPLFVAAKTSGNKTFKGDALVAADETAKSYAEGNVTITGVLTAPKSDIKGAYIMSGGNLCTVAYADNTLPVNRWYMTVDSSSKIRVRIADVDGGFTTGVEDMPIFDVVIKTPPAAVTVNGTTVDPSTLNSGVIYIQNGKKYMVK